MINQHIHNTIINICQENNLDEKAYTKLISFINSLAEGNENQEDIERRIEILLSSFLIK